MRMIEGGFDKGMMYRFEEGGKYVTVSTGRLRISRRMYRKIEEQVGRLFKRKNLKF